MTRPPDKTPIAIFDTGIAFAAALNPSGVSEKLVRRLMVEGEVSVFMSNRLREEYGQALTKSVFAARYAFMPQA